MIRIQQFVFNPLSENTYLLYDESGECLIIDPGCYERQEQDELVKFIRQESLNPVMLLNTHCHIDHVLGNKFVYELYGLAPRFHPLEEEVLNAMVPWAAAWGLRYDPAPLRGDYLREGEKLRLGEEELDILFTPGHSPGSLSFYCEKERFVIAGDTLFSGSIGRTDLPGGDHDTLIQSIKSQLLSLDDEVQVYPGHGPSTSIGLERVHNPFL